MPQMAPTLWLMLMMFSILMIMMINSNIFFMKKTKINKINLQPKKKSWKW